MRILLAVALTVTLLLTNCCAMAEDITLQLWSIATESDPSHQGFVDAIAAFEADHPGIRIEHNPTENEAYKTKLKAAMSSGDDLPDIFFTWGTGFLSEFVDAGRVVCLDDAYPAYADALPENMTVNVRYDGSMYGVPYNQSMIVLYANMDLLSQVGFDHIPATFDEMMTCCEALKSAGIIPFGVSGMELWALSEYVEPLVLKSVGADRLHAMYTGEASWEDEGVVSAIAAFQDMIQKGYFDPSGPALKNDEVRNNFIAGKYAFYQNGTWNSIYLGENAAFEVQAGSFPPLNPGVSAKELIGGPNNSLAVTEASAHREEAVEAAFYLARFLSEADYRSGANLPCWKADADAQIGPLIAATVEMAGNADGMVYYGDNFLSADDANTYLDYIGLAYAGDITPEEYAEYLEADLH